MKKKDFYHQLTSMEVTRSKLLKRLNMTDEAWTLYVDEQEDIPNEWATEVLRSAKPLAKKCYEGLPEELNEEGIENLIIAIIGRAVADYRDLGRDEGNCNGRSMERIREFFRSGWYRMMTELDGEWLLEQLDTEIREGRYERSYTKTL